MISMTTMRRARTRGASFGVASALLLAVTGAQAATFSIVGGNNATLDTDFNPLNPTWVAANEFGIDVGSAVKRFNQFNIAGNGLFVAPETAGYAVDLTFIYKGSEASYKNLFDDAIPFASALFDNKSGPNADSTLSFGGGLVPLSFKSVGAGNKFAINGTSIDPALKISFVLSPDHHTAYAFLEDIAKDGDKDFDDMAIRIDATEHCVTNCPAPPPETPLPAAVWLLGSVLAGGAGFGRWRKRKAKKTASA